jgi:hypothetical protein
MNDRSKNTAIPVENPSESRIHALIWLLSLLFLLIIPMLIISQGFVPGGDARRHVAKAFTDKPYTEIIKFGPQYTMDHSPGWEWVVKQVHVQAGMGLEGLMGFSVAILMLCVFLAPFPWIRRPEAWLAALMAMLVAIPELMTRLSQARPFLITEGVLIAILMTWGRKEEVKPSALKLTFTTIGIGLSVWMHGAWYLWALPLMAFAIAQAWNRMLWLGGCIGAGCIAGAMLTGRPYEFLRQAILMVARITHEHLPQWMLVGEFRPSYGEYATVMLIGGVLLWRRLVDSEREDLLKNPIFCMIILCWILGFKGDRFWADWGTAAALVWLAIQFEAILDKSCSANSSRSLLITILLGLPLMMDASNDLDRRYTINLTEPFLEATDSKLKDWMPGRSGIFYSAQMGFFYNTFYKNPNADWRYVLGMEPAMMTDEDLEILRKIQWNGYIPQAYQLWVDRMKPQDRLELESYSKPNLPSLEWYNAVGNVWIGKLPGS